MKLTSFALALLLTLAIASDAAAQRRGFYFQPAPPPVRAAAPTMIYQAPSYWQQSHWVYGYMPYGYDSFGHSGAAWGGQFGYVPQTFASSARDLGPPPRSTLFPAVPYSAFAEHEQKRAAEKRGYMNVSVPVVDAKVWINGQLMTQTGKERTYMTPLLDSPAKQYTFDIRASWSDEFGPFTKESKVLVRSGETKDVVFAAK